ncbi:MAG: hypothetical protein A3F69_01115 [Acidobacteria bacterium RIFCSPLOWO2_12_FULL_66_10]|nr:MAG: hypothetical protein A3F69_01115 [Acidobacteria bacterium RIFCSPLOWO2_12_FULL_66_10]
MPDIKRILCPLDFSDASRHAIDHAIAMARWYDARIAGVHVFNPTGFTTAVVATPAYVGEEMTTGPEDLIAMGTHGVGGFEHLVLGSVTEKVVRRAACPVLTLRR